MCTLSRAWPVTLISQTLHQKSVYIVSDRSAIAAWFQIRDSPLVETFVGCGGCKAGAGLGEKWEMSTTS